MVIGIDGSRAYQKERTGTENYSYELITRMARLITLRKHKIVVFVRPNANIPNGLLLPHIEWREIRNKYLWTQLGLAAQLWGTKLDLLWIPAHTLPILRPTALKTVVTIHGLEYKWLKEYNNPLQRWYLPLSTFYAARSATRLIAVSEFTRSQLLTELGVDPDRVEVIHEGVMQSAHKLNADRQSSHALDSYGLRYKDYVLFVGTLQPRKNLPALIAAFAKVAVHYPTLKLVIAGAPGWDTEEIYRAVQANLVTERIILTGRVDDNLLSQLYSQAKMYVQPSIQEGFGLPILEAMKAGLPVISSDGGALPEVVANAGIVVPLGSRYEDGLAKAMRRILDDDELSAKLSAKGRARAAQLSWDIAAKLTTELLLNIAGYRV